MRIARLLVIGAAWSMAACLGLSQGVRPRVVEEKKLRLGVGQGFTRDVALDFAFAEPSTETSTSIAPALLSELSAHYGVAKQMDIGARLRPFSRGLKLEWQLQLADPRGDAVGLAIGVGLDAFYRTRIEVGCEDHGCFYREYGGAVIDVPIVLSRRTVRWLTLFVAARPQYMFIKGRQSYKADDGSFPTLKLDKTVSQPIGGWAAGILLEWGPVRLIPQVAGATVKNQDAKIAHAVYPSLDFGIEW